MFRIFSFPIIFALSLIHFLFRHLIQYFGRMAEKYFKKGQKKEKTKNEIKFSIDERELNNMINEEFTDVQRKREYETRKGYNQAINNINAYQPKSFGNYNQKNNDELIAHEIYLNDVLAKSKEQSEQQAKLEKERTEMIQNREIEEQIRKSEEEEEIEKVKIMSKKLEEQRQKEEEQMKIKMKRQEREKLINELTQLITMYSKCFESDYKTIERLLNGYEDKTKSLLNDGFRDGINRESLSMEGKSSLILEVIQVLRYTDIDIEKICKFFSWDLSNSSFVCQGRTALTVYNQESFEFHDLQIDETSKFSHKLINDQFVTINIRGDGNCLWNSVSVALFGDYSKMKTLRLLTALTLLEHKNTFIEYSKKQKSKYGYSHELSFEELVTASTELQVWGDEIHILALSLALRRPIYSYGSLINFVNQYYMSYEELKKEFEKDSVANHFTYLADTAFKDHTPIMLYYNGENHYNVVLPTNQITVRPLVPKSQILEPLFGEEEEVFPQLKSNEKDRNSLKSYESENKDSKECLKPNQSIGKSIKPGEFDDKNKEQVTLINTSELAQLKRELQRCQNSSDSFQNALKTVEKENKELKTKIAVNETKIKILENELNSLQIRTRNQFYGQYQNGQVNSNRYRSLSENQRKNSSGVDDNSKMDIDQVD